jgi:thiol-disulfide isomerase/thioredoxin
MRTIRLLFIVILPSISSFLAFSQDSSFVTVHYPAGLHANKVYVDYFDGISTFRKSFDSSSDITFKGNRYWRYSDVSILYPDTTYKGIWVVNTFWVGDQPADIYIVPDSNGYKHFERYRLKNAYSVADSGMTQLNFFEKAIRDSIATTFELTKKGNSDSLEKVATSLFTRLTYNELIYLRNVKDSYFKLWFFRTKVAGSHLLPVDTLLNAYHSLFPDSIQRGGEGQYIEKLIGGRLGLKVGGKAPHFALHSTTGRLISSENTRGKYVLFNFWASWCGPCIAEMARIATFHSMYDSNRLLVISITLDTREKEFKAAAERLHMTWPLIFGDQDILSRYEVSNIPQLFLLDTDGNIIYRLNEVTEKGIVPYDDDQLSKLNDILSKCIGQH